MPFFAREGQGSSSSNPSSPPPPPRHVLEMLACEQANPWAWAPMFAKEVSLLNLSVGFNWYCFLYNQAGQLN